MLRLWPLMFLAFASIGHAKECQSFLSPWTTSPYEIIVEGEDEDYISWGQYYDEAKDYFHFTANLDINGIFTFSAYLKNYKHNVRSAISGQEYFKKALWHIKRKNIKQIELQWHPYSDNHKVFRQALLDGATDIEAALATWSSKQVLAQNFKLEHVFYSRDDVLKKVVGTYVIVTFTPRPWYNLFSRD